MLLWIVKGVVGLCALAIIWVFMIIQDDPTPDFISDPNSASSEDESPEGNSAN